MTMMIISNKFYSVENKFHAREHQPTREFDEGWKHHQAFAHSLYIFHSGSCFVCCFFFELVISLAGTIQHHNEAGARVTSQQRKFYRNFVLLET